jgi:hypothetical protein
MRKLASAGVQSVFELVRAFGDTADGVKCLLTHRLFLGDP